MAQKWYQRASVQAALIGGTFLVVGTLLGVALPHILQAPGLQTQIGHLKAEVATKQGEIQRLETLLTPYRTIALEMFGGSEAEAMSKLLLRLQDLESAVAAVRDYSSVAQLDPVGRKFAGDVVDRSPLAVMFDDTYEIGPNGNFTFKKDAAAEAKYREIIQRYPKFPLTYYYLALTLKLRDDDEWRDQAEKAKRILEQTTKIDGHNPAHDEVFSRVVAMLQQDDKS